jgi:hypothetical protein
VLDPVALNIPAFGHLGGFLSVPTHARPVDDPAHFAGRQVKQLADISRGVPMLIEGYGELVLPKWQHGCSTPCGHKFGGHCPERAPLRAETAGTKSKAGKRGVGLPDELVAMLKAHQREHERERETAADMWRETGYVFTTPRGEPLNPRTDYTEWKRLLERASVPERRLHDARHTAATVLLLLGIPDRTVMGIMGWSSTAMAARYQHIIAAIRRDVATSVGRLLWKPAEQPTEDALDLTDEQRAAVRLLLTTLPEPWRERLGELFGDQDDNEHTARPRLAS